MVEHFFQQHIRFFGFVNALSRLQAYCFHAKMWMKGHKSTVEEASSFQICFSHYESVQKNRFAVDPTFPEAILSEY